MIAMRVAIRSTDMVSSLAYSDTSSIASMLPRGGGEGERWGRGVWVRERGGGGVCGSVLFQAGQRTCRAGVRGVEVPGWGHRGAFRQANGAPVEVGPIGGGWRAWK